MIMKTGAGQVCVDRGSGVLFLFSPKGLFYSKVMWAHSHEVRPSVLSFSGLCPTYLTCVFTLFSFSVFCYAECTARCKQTIAILAQKASHESLYWMKRKFMASATVKIMQITNCSILKM